MANVVRADEDGEKSGGRQLQMLQTPEQVLGAVAADAQIERTVFGQLLRPRGLILPGVGQRVAGKNHEWIPILDLCNMLLVFLQPHVADAGFDS